MAEADQTKPKSARQRIIEWYESALYRYRGMIGKVTEYKTLITEKFIERLENRIEELKLKERWNDTEGRLPQES